MKTLKWILSFVAILGTVFVLASCAMDVSAQDDTYLTVDINPSVEMIVNRREKVIYVNPLNEDAEVLLSSIHVIGMKLEDALDLIIQTAIELGYIDLDEEESYVYVSTISKDSEMGEKIKERAKEHINNAFGKRMMMGKAEDKGYQPDFVLEAESYGVTPGFMFLAKKASEASDELLFEEALLLTVDELQAIIKDVKQQKREVAQTFREDFISAKEALFNLYFEQFNPLVEEKEQKQVELLDLETRLEEKEAALLVAVEDEIAAIELEITLIQAEIVAIQAEIQALNESILALREALREEVKVLRDAFHKQSEQIRNQFAEMFQNRKNEHQNRVNQFFEERSENAKAIKERIENFQKGRP